MRPHFLLLFCLCTFSLASYSAERPASPVFVYTLTPTAIDQPLNLLGQLTAVESVNLSPVVTELVSAIHFSDGQHVKAGDLLIEMTSAEEHAQLSQLRAQVLDAQQQYQRLTSLQSAKLNSVASVDQQRAIYNAAQAQLNAAQARLADRLIIAPFTGRLGLRHLSVGSLVRPGDVIAQLEDDSRVNLDIEIPETLRNRVAVNSAFRAQTFDAATILQGKIEQFDNRANSATHNVLARTSLANPKGELLSGMSLQVQILHQLTNQLMLPESAIIQEATRSYVFVLGPDNKVKRQSISLGLHQDGWVAASSGLAAGDTIITQGAARLTPGASVKIMGEDHGQPLHEILQQGKP